MKKDACVVGADPEISRCITRSTQALRDILGGNLLSAALYGSVVLNDFRLGWSDIDLLCLTGERITRSEAEQLLQLRQRSAEETGDPLFRSIEGTAVQSLPTCCSGSWNGAAAQTFPEKRNRDRL